MVKRIAPCGSCSGAQALGFRGAICGKAQRQKLTREPASAGFLSSIAPMSGYFWRIKKISVKNDSKDR
jgi:hypothetical protein